MASESLYPLTVSITAGAECCQRKVESQAAVPSSKNTSGETVKYGVVTQLFVGHGLASRTHNLGYCCFITRQRAHHPD